ncbi:unnamed protein product [Phaeothamnion confervicola]
MKAKVLFFASARELAGVSSTEVELPGEASSTSALRRRLAEQIPALAPIAATITLAVNHEYLPVEEDAPLKDGDEVALIPPISGG